MAGRKRNWKVAFLASRDQVDALKNEVLLCYQVLATVAIDGKCDSVEKDFLSELAEAVLPYRPRDMLDDMGKGEFQWWNTNSRPLEEETGEESG